MLGVLVVVMVKQWEAEDPWVIWAQLSAEFQNWPPGRRSGPGPVLELRGEISDGTLA